MKIAKNKQIYHDNNNRNNNNNNDNNSNDNNITTITIYNNNCIQTKFIQQIQYLLSTSW